MKNVAMPESLFEESLPSEIPATLPPQEFSNLLTIPKSRAPSITIYQHPIISEKL